MTDITDPRAFFESLVHDLGPKAKPEYLTYHEGETIMEEAAPVKRMLIVRHGEVAASQCGVHMFRYIADPKSRYGALPILSASDYCYSSGSTYRYVAETHVEALAIDTRVLIDMGKKNTNLVLFRNLVLFSDMGAVLRKKIEEEYERTDHLPCFNPKLPEDLLLRFETATFEDFYLDFALRVMGQLTVGRMVRSDHPSTAIAPLKRPFGFALTDFKSF